VSDVADDHGAVLADSELRAVVLADSQSLRESERRREPGDRLPYVRVDQHRDHGGRGHRPVRPHA